MLRILKLALLAMLLFIVITIVSFVYLKWWQAMIVVAVMIVGLLLALRYIVANFGKILGAADPRILQVSMKMQF